MGLWKREGWEVEVTTLGGGGGVSGVEAWTLNITFTFCLGLLFFWIIYTWIQHSWSPLYPLTAAAAAKKVIYDEDKPISVTHQFAVGRQCGRKCKRRDQNMKTSSRLRNRESVGGNGSKSREKILPETVTLHDSRRLSCESGRPLSLGSCFILLWKKNTKSKPLFQCCQEFIWNCQPV